MAWYGPGSTRSAALALAAGLAVLATGCAVGPAATMTTPERGCGEGLTTSSASCGTCAASRRPIMSQTAWP
ncbi:hypothetical protein, partial [Streptomyces spiramenti]